MAAQHDIVIVGAGMAGLSCALRLQERGQKALLLEASDAPGGRVRTDDRDGFLLDRGFQVFLTAYPEARRVFDYPALRLRAFQPGAMVRVGSRFHLVSDPRRDPLHAPQSAWAPIGTIGDKLRIPLLQRDVTTPSLQELFARPEMTTRELLRQRGFSNTMVERFFQPFFGGIFLRSDLRPSRRLFEFVFRMMATGDTTLPERGIQALSDQLAAKLPVGSIRLGCRVEKVEPGCVWLQGGEPVRAEQIVIATEGPAATRLTGRVPLVGSRPVLCLQYGAPEPPVRGAYLVLNGTGQGPINDMAVLSEVAPRLAPAGRSLVSVTVLPGRYSDPGITEQRARQQLTEWFGKAVRSWRLLRFLHIPHALPDVEPQPAQTKMRVAPGLYVCGDHRLQPSLQGALVSGRQAAEELLENVT